MWCSFLSYTEVRLKSHCIEALQSLVRGIHDWYIGVLWVILHLILTYMRMWNWMPSTPISVYLYYSSMIHLFIFLTWPHPLLCIVSAQWFLFVFSSSRNWFAWLTLLFLVISDERQAPDCPVGGWRPFWCWQQMCTRLREEIYGSKAVVVERGRSSGACGHGEGQTVCKTPDLPIWRLCLWRTADFLQYYRSMHRAIFHRDKILFGCSFSCFSLLA